MQENQTKYCTNWKSGSLAIASKQKVEDKLLRCSLGHPNGLQRDSLNSAIRKACSYMNFSFEKRQDKMRSRWSFGRAQID
ncbi:hypothetical protein H5410_025917 [Solanum commersonii]|uniref:Uncharacterized protein n=1 Tax=Solanum commersonii TaxID=4109 RepID=A0A9J5YV27_SOLCO|nr:hypothetical protein H5410_025917 [Solanum commersonii]